MSRGIRNPAGFLVAGERSNYSEMTSLLALALGWAIGYAPGWLWNLGNEWESFHYLVPGRPARTRRARPAWPP